MNEVAELGQGAPIRTYLQFPGATPEIEARFLTSLADSYTASGLAWEARSPEVWPTADSTRA